MLFRSKVRKGQGNSPPIFSIDAACSAQRCAGCKNSKQHREQFTTLQPALCAPQPHASEVEYTKCNQQQGKLSRRAVKKKLNCDQANQLCKRRPMAQPAWVFSNSSPATRQQKTPGMLVLVPVTNQHGRVSTTQYKQNPEEGHVDRKSTRLNSSHMSESRMPSSA